MNSESQIQLSTSKMFSALLSLIILSSMMFFPKIGNKNNLKPYSKGPRPYNLDMVQTIIKESDADNKKTKDNYLPIILDASEKYGVDPYLIKAIIMAESSFNPSAVSSKGAVGLMQIMPATAVSLGVIDLFDPVENINGGVKYLKWLIEKFGGDTTLAVAAYNAGRAKVLKYKGIPPFKFTQYYVKKVFEYYEDYRS